MCKALAQANGKDREKRQSREADGVLGRIIRESMVHPGGFEPPTARFVAEYSIQLSYGCIGDTALLRVHVMLIAITFKKMVHPGGFEPPTARFVAEYSIQLSYGCIGIYCFATGISIAAKAILSKRWCIREDSNLRPLGS